MRLHGAVTLVTGASGGIGRATARRLAAEGARLVLAGRNRAALDELAATTGGRVLVADLTEPDAPELVAKQAGEVDVLVNNAGVCWGGPIARMPAGELDGLVACNLLAPLHLTRLLLPGMLARHQGHVVQVASMAGYVGVTGEAVYAATKAALIAFASSAQGELAGSGVGMSVVAPGPVDTPFLAGTSRAEMRPRPMPPERVAEAIVRAIVRGQPEVFVPGWLRPPIRLLSASPGLYRRLTSRIR